VKKLSILALLAAGTLPPLATAARAELPPTAYEAMRGKAAIVAILAIQSVQRSAARTDGTMETVRVTVRARVLSVIRGSGLAMGATVTIHYTHSRPVKPGWVGPSPIPILEKGTRVLAWLNRAKGFLAPAARGRSFETLR
jgi:hypothetical protein